MHTCTPSDCIFDGPITNLFSILCILIEILSRAHAKGKKSLKGFEFGGFIGRFPSNRAAGIAVKGSMLAYISSSGVTCTNLD